MALRDDQKFSERMNTAAKARAEMLEKGQGPAPKPPRSIVAGPRRGERIALAAGPRGTPEKGSATEEKRLAAIEAEKQRVLAEQARLKAEEEAKIQAELDHQARIKVCRGRAQKRNRRLERAMPAMPRARPPRRKGR